MEILAIGDLHLPAATTKTPRGLGKYVSQPEKVILDEVRKVLDIGLKRGINTAFLLGDLCDGHAMSQASSIAFMELVTEYRDIQFHALLGNHDVFGYPKDGDASPYSGKAGKAGREYHPDHSQTAFSFLESVQKMPGGKKFLGNLHLYSSPTMVSLNSSGGISKSSDGKGSIPVQFLPYGSDLRHYFRKNGSRVLHVFHDEVRGSKGDNGRLAKEGVSPKGKDGDNVYGVSGHLHTSQRIKDIYYPGTLYQVSFGEKPKKFFGIIEAKAASKEANKLEELEVEFHRHHPKYQLLTHVVQSRKDLNSIPCGEGKLVKLVIEDGVAVTTADYPSQANIVEVKPYKGLQELAQALTSDIEVGEALQVDLDAFFSSWLESLDVEDEYRSTMMSLRKKILSRASSR